MNRSFRLLLLLMTAVPLYAQSELNFAQLAVGGNPAYETVLQIVNEVESSNPIVISVYQGQLSGAANGTPMAVHFDGAAASPTFSTTLAPFQELTTILTGDAGALKNGWLRVRSTLVGGKISGNLIFRQRGAAGLTDSVGATTPQSFRQAIIQLDQRETGSDSGIALVNPDTAEIVVLFDLFQGANRFATPVSVKLQPNQHYAKLVSEIYPGFGNRQGTLIVEAAAGRSVPCMALRLDGAQLTSIPVRPLGFVFSYIVSNDGGAVTEKGYWMFDQTGFNLIGTGFVETPSASGPFEVTGSWQGTNFQFRYRKVFSGGTIGMVVFNGTSAGSESTVGSDGKSKAVTGKVTTIGSDGKVVSVDNFSAYHKFGSPPQ